MAEPRAHPRYAVEIDAEVRSGAQVIPARTRNVSRGGLALLVHQPIAVGARALRSHGESCTGADRELAGRRRRADDQSLVAAGMLYHGGRHRPPNS